MLPLKFVPTHWFHDILWFRTSWSTPAGEGQQLVTVQWCILAEGRAASLCGSCTLAVLVGCGLLSFPFVNLFAPFFFLFFPSSPFDSPSLSPLPPCRVLLRTSCCLVITVWLSPSLLLFPCRWSLLQPLQPLPLPVSLSRGSASLLYFCWRFIHLFINLFVFWGGRSFAFPYLFVDLHSFFFKSSDMPPSPLPAMRSTMVQCCACLQFCDWSVGLSPVRVQLCQLVQCCGLSSEWTMCIKLHSFLVWHGLIPAFRMSKCHVEVMLSWSGFHFGI